MLERDSGIHKHSAQQQLGLLTSICSVKSLCTLPVVVSKNVKLASMHGSIQLNCEKPKRCGIRIGFPIVGIFDKKYERTIWDNSGVVDFKGPAFMGGLGYQIWVI